MGPMVGARAARPGGLLAGSAGEGRPERVGVRRPQSPRSTRSSPWTTRPVEPGPPDGAEVRHRHRVRGAELGQRTLVVPRTLTSTRAVDSEKSAAKAPTPEIWVTSRSETAAPTPWRSTDSASATASPPWERSCAIPKTRLSVP